MKQPKQTMAGKVAIITGASSGIGKACAYEFANRGATVVLAARNEESLHELERDLISNGFSALAVKTDVTRLSDCKNLIDKTVSNFGKIDILVNNAGISMRALFRDVDIDVIRTLMEVNFFGAIYCTKFALPYLLDSKGSVVGVSSIAGFHGLPGRSGYSASKFALQGFLETLRIENMKHGLHVMVAAPGFTATNMRVAALTADGSPQKVSPRNEKSMLSPEKVARVIARGIHKMRRNIIISLQGKLSILFQRIIPKVIDRILYGYIAREANSPFR
jgi:short-subunit dehydrogenase